VILTVCEDFRNRKKISQSRLLSDKTALLKVHKEDGTIQEERTYPRSADPSKNERLILGSTLRLVQISKAQGIDSA
jgi:hypothetical protein